MSLRCVAVGGFGLMLSPSADLDRSIAHYVRVHDRGKDDERHSLCREAWQRHGSDLVPTFDELVGDGEIDVVTVCAGKNGDDIKILRELVPLLEQRCKARPILLHLSTVSAAFARAAHAYCARQGVEYFHAPLTGGPTGARTHTMLILAAGKEEIYARLQPMFELIGKPRYFGEDVAKGAWVKLIGQHLVFNGLTGATTAAALHGTCFRMELGDPQQADFLDFLNGGAGGTAQIPRALMLGVRDGKWDVGFLSHHAAIDAIYAAKLAAESGLSIRFSVQPMVNTALALAYLLHKYESGPTPATHAIARELATDPQSLDNFMARFDRPGNIPDAIAACVEALPVSLRESVLLDVDASDFEQ